MRTVVLSCLLALVTVGARAEGPQPPRALQNVHRIVTLGDSITEAGGRPGGYVWLLRHYLNTIYPDQNFEVINAGISGHKSTDMLARFQHDVIDKKPDMVTISVGVNDVWHGFYDNHPNGDGPRGIPLDQYTAHVDDMITQAQAAHIRVVVLSTTVIQEMLDSPENHKLIGYNHALEMLAHKHHAMFIDFQKPFHDKINAYHAAGGADKALTVDGVHMNPDGDRLMVATILHGLGVPERLIERARVKVEEAALGAKE